MFDMYEVDLRNRKTGDSVECIYSGDDHTAACSVADNWNKEHLPDYDPDKGYDDYVDHKSEGLTAALYHVEDKSQLLGVGVIQ